jgi:hypothetical protein
MELMHQDDGGRRATVIGLHQSMHSPQKAMESLGSTSFAEPQSLTRHGAEHAHAAEDKRMERHEHGHVPFKTENRVPDVGGLGWRTKTGHLLKNQSYFCQLDKINKWDLPTHAGINTWQDWHGPKMRTDADMMERLDNWDKVNADWEAKKTFVNTTRVQTLDRFYNRKLNRSQYESSTSWAPHLRAKREVHSSHELFSCDMASKPQKELKKVFTKPVLKRDREAVRQICTRIQNEETWKKVWLDMEGERRADIRAGLQMRQAHTDRLMNASGQPVRSEGSLHTLPNSSSTRTHELAQPRETFLHKDVTRQTDFRGLIHPDEEHALEALMPGYGHEMSLEFRERATRSCDAGWPPPPRATIPPRARASTREDEMSSVQVAKFAIPASQPRLERLGARTHDGVLKDASKVQFQSTKAPPAPDQSKTLLNEDWSPATSLRDPHRLTGSFTRTSPSHRVGASKQAKSTTPSAQALGHVPPPTRQYVYPVLTVMTPRAKPQSLTSSRTSPCSPVRRNQSEPALSAPWGGAGDANASFGSIATNGQGSPLHGTAYFKETVRQEKLAARAAVSQVGKVCAELDAFEATKKTKPNISNFFNTPRRTGGQEMPLSPMPEPGLR